MSNSNIFKLINNITCEMIAKEVEVFLQDKKKLNAETVKTQAGYLVQAKAADSWKKFVGMENATQVQIIPTGDVVNISVGSGKWVDKAGAGAVGALVFAPLLVTAAIGAFNQKKLPEEIFNHINQFIINGGVSSMVSAGPSSYVDKDEVVCSCCNAKNPKSSKFCLNCGNKLGRECTNCSAMLADGVKFCPECGTNNEVALECAQCNAKIKENQKFCLECGFKIK